MSLPIRLSGTVDWALRVKVPLDLTGPILVFPKKFWNPSELNSIPTCDG